MSEEKKQNSTESVKKTAKTAKSSTKKTKKELEIIERREIVLNLFKSNVSYRKISAHLQTIMIEGKQRFKGVSPATVCSDLKAILQEIKGQLSLDIEDYKTLTLERIGELRLAGWTNALRGNIKERELQLKFIALEAKLLGLESPQKHEINADEILCKLLGMEKHELEQLKNEVTAQDETNE